tara:strand:+ start:169 stop:1110 length:942 start_codon:yes stop_codon:yes gene_type:complete
MEKVLVTGGSGFLGTHLVNKLLEQGRQVKILDIKEPKIKNVEFIKADIRNHNKVLEVTKDVDTIFHLASLVPQSKVDFSVYNDVICNGTASILKACKKYNIKMVHVSSSGVYGGARDKPLTEDHPKNPSSNYGRAKMNAELQCQKYALQGVNVVMVRPMAIIGPGIYGIFKLFLKLVKKNIPLITFGNGSNRIQLVSTSDTVDALLLAERYQKTGEVFNLGSDNIPTVKQQYKALIKHTKSKSFIIPIPSLLARVTFRTLYTLRLSPLLPEHYYVLDKNSILDITKTKKELGWKPQKNNTDMIIETFDGLFKR